MPITRDNLSSEDRKARILSLYREGIKQREISRIVGISQPAVRSVLIRAGLIIGDNHPMEPSRLLECLMSLLGDSDRATLGRYLQGFSGNELTGVRYVLNFGLAEVRKRGYA